MSLDMPYFMNNKEWYIENPKYDMFDEESKEPQFILTSKAPLKAIKSYKQYMKDLADMENQYIDDEIFE